MPTSWTRARRSLVARRCEGDSEESAWHGVEPPAPPSAAPGRAVFGGRGRAGGELVPFSRARPRVPGAVIPVTPFRAGCGGGASGTHLARTWRRGWSQPGASLAGRWVTQPRGQPGTRGGAGSPAELHIWAALPRATPDLRPTSCAPSRSARHQHPRPRLFGPALVPAPPP